MERVYVGIGSNLAEPLQQLRTAIAALRSLPLSHLVAVSSLYASDPLGPSDQPRYINAVAALDSTLAPMQMLDALQTIEREQGRIRGERWGARTLDLDIILFGQRIIDEPRLQVPHYHMQARAFVLYPLAEIAGSDLRLPDGRSLDALLAACPFVGLERLGDDGNAVTPPAQR
jgi:2-amino-4-hydroxy-6-hydroxymethyldihydropteridine diphosphokinase